MATNSELLTLLGRSVDYLKWNCYRSRQHRLVYVATPKVACTSLKWWFASLAGVSESLQKPNGSAETLPELVIHDTFHMVAPEFAGLSREDLLDALTSQEYFRFAVVRNPYSRIFSAWQSKLLLREPLQSKPYFGLDFFESEVRSKSDLARAFEGFLEYLLVNEAPHFTDEHWTPQVTLLRPDIIEYSLLSKIEEADNLSAVVVKWLGDDALDPMDFRVTNESLVPYSAEYVTARSSELIRSMYKSDFEAFGYDAAVSYGGKKLSDTEFRMALKGINLIRGRNQRLDEIRSGMSHNISVLNDTLQQQASKLIVAHEEASALKHQSEAAVLGFQSQVAGLDAEIARQRAEISKRDAEIASQNAEIARLDAELVGRDAGLAKRDAELASRNVELAKRGDELASRDAELAKREVELAGRDAEIASLGLRIKDIEASTSWRITAPLRWLKQRMLIK